MTNNRVYKGLLINEKNVSSLVRDNKYNLTIEEDTTVEVIYEEYIIPKYKLTHGDYISPSTDELVLEGTTVTVKVNLPINYYFKYLVINDEKIYELNNNEYQFVINGDTHIYVEYLELEKSVDVSNETELKFYLEQSFVEIINFNNNILINNKLIINRPITKNGNGYSLKYDNSTKTEDNYLIEIKNTKNVELNDLILSNKKLMLVNNSFLTTSNLTLNDFNEHGIEIIDNKSKVRVENNLKTNTADKPLIIIKNITINDNYVVHDSLYEYIKDTTFGL